MMAAGGAELPGQGPHKALSKGRGPPLAREEPSRPRKGTAGAKACGMEALLLLLPSDTRPAGLVEARKPSDEVHSPGGGAADEVSVPDRGVTSSSGTHNAALAQAGPRRRHAAEGKTMQEGAIGSNSGHKRSEALCPTRYSLARPRVHRLAPPMPLLEASAGLLSDGMYRYTMTASSVRV